MINGSAHVLFPGLSAPAEELEALALEEQLAAAEVPLALGEVVALADSSFL